jgi:hypothetical protein
LIEASKVFFERIFLLYSFACPVHAEFCIIIAAYHLFIIDNAFSTKIIHLPGLEYGGLRTKASAGKATQSFPKPYFQSKSFKESLFKILELPSPIKIIFNTASI